jgi:hypothetical protein
MCLHSYSASPQPDKGIFKEEESNWITKPAKERMEWLHHSRATALSYVGGPLVRLGTAGIGIGNGMLKIWDVRSRSACKHTSRALGDDDFQLFLLFLTQQTSG